MQVPIVPSVVTCTHQTPSLYTPLVQINRPASHQILSPRLAAGRHWSSLRRTGFLPSAEIDIDIDMADASNNANAGTQPKQYQDIRDFLMKTVGFLPKGERHTRMHTQNRASVPVCCARPTNSIDSLLFLPLCVSVSPHPFLFPFPFPFETLSVGYTLVVVCISYRSMVW